MTTEIKENGQIFETITKKEIKSQLSLLLTGETIWTDEDSSLEILYTDETVKSFMEGDKIEKIAISKIAEMIYRNPSSCIIYNAVITYNEKYEDWEVNLK